MKDWGGLVDGESVGGLVGGECYWCQIGGEWVGLQPTNTRHSHSHIINQNHNSKSEISIAGRFRIGCFPIIVISKETTIFADESVSLADQLHRVSYIVYMYMYTRGYIFF